MSCQLPNVGGGAGQYSFLCIILLEGIKLWPSTKFMQKIFLIPSDIFKNFIPLLFSLPSHTAVDPHSPFLGANSIQLFECSCTEIQPIKTRSMTEETVII